MAHLDLVVSRDYDLTPSAMWPVIADLGGYAVHVTDLAATDVVSGDGEGAVRRCTTTKHQSWLETVTEWEEGNRYRVEVDTSTYPFPLRQLFRSFAGTWTVDPARSGSRVTIRFDADVRGGPVLVPIAKLMARKATEDLERTLDSYGQTAGVRS